MPGNIAADNPLRFTRLQGTTGTMEISYGSQYWECKICFSFPRGMKTNDFVFDIGICQEIVVDRITDFFKNYGAYSAMAIKWGNKDIKLEFNFIRGRYSRNTFLFIEIIEISLVLNY